MNISRNEILDALREAARNISSGPEDAFTIAEMAEGLGMHRQTTMRYLYPLVRTGDIEFVRVRRVSMDGVTRPLPGYRFVRPPKKRR